MQVFDMARYCKSIHIRTVVKKGTMVVRVRGMRQFRVRVWIAVRLIRLAAWVMWTPVEVHHDLD